MFSLDENIALARQFLLEHFVSRGMVVDFAIHVPDTEPCGISNPHFHVMAPIRPIEQNGKWGMKQRRVYELDEEGNKRLDADGNYIFNAVPTTDWGSPETLEYWREQWAALCNAKFEEKGLPERIDHRSYERQGVDILPTIHEGSSVRQMEAKGIRTDKGEFNRWIKATNSVIREIKKKINALLDWLKDAKEELSKPRAPDLIMLLQMYFNQRNAGAYSQRAKINNLKEYSELCQYLLDHNIHDLETLETHVSNLRSTTDSLKKKLDSQTAEMKTLRKLPEYFVDYKRLKPVFDGLQKIKFTKAREKYKADHAADLKRFYEARRIISQRFPDGKYNRKALETEYAELEQQHDATYSEFKAIRAESQTLWKIKSHIDTARKNIEPIQINAPTQKQEKEI